MDAMVSLHLGLRGAMWAALTSGVSRSAMSLLVLTLQSSLRGLETSGRGAAPPARV